MITHDTAAAIAYAYRDISAAEALLEKVNQWLSEPEPDIRDQRGRQRGVQLGLPHGDSGHRILDVPLALAVPIIENTIAQKRARIAALTAKALQEASTAPQEPSAP